MVKKNQSQKGRKLKGNFLPLPDTLLSHPDFKNLSSRAVKLLIDIASPFNGFNNGDFSAAKSLMKPRGWNSNDQLDKAKKELLNKDFIRVTRQGGRKVATLYAVTWLCINDCKGKLDVKSTDKPPRNFRI